MKRINEKQRALVFTHVTIIDAAGGPNRLDMTVVISGGRITDIEETGKIRPARGAQVVNATGKFLIPGLWDMHAHRSDKRYLPLYIANGVTGVRIMWGFPVHHAWREETSRGSLLCPRLIIGSPIIDGAKPLWSGSISVSNVVEARQVVRQVKKNGADFVKILEGLSREVYFAIVDESKKQRIPLVGHIPWTISAKEASDAGQQCIEHLGGAISPGILLDCSNREEELRKEGEKAFDGITVRHPQPSQVEALKSFSRRIPASYNPKKAAALFLRFVKNNTWFCPTLTVLRNFVSMDDTNVTHDPRLKFMSKKTRESWKTRNNPLVASNTAEDWANWKRFYQKELEIVGTMRGAGVNLLAGTDEPNPFCFPGFSLHDELERLVQAGLTPMEALQAATYKAAEFLGMTNSLGMVEKGKIADLVILEANPLEHISNTKKIAAVVVNGKYYPRTALDDMLAKTEALANQKSIAEAILKTITEKDIKSAILRYHRLKATQSETYDFSESELNSLGYKLLEMKKIREAIEILKLNVEIYPKSYNVYDSLAEAYMVNGENKLTIKNYAKSLELNPFNWGAAETLKKLKND